MRNINPDIWRDEWFAEQEPLAQLLWIGLISKVADDQGRFLFNHNLIKSDLFPMSEQVSAQDINVLLCTFRVDGKLIEYCYNGKGLLQVANWWKYQGSAAWMSESKYPPPEGWVDCWRYHGKGNELKKSPNWETKEAGYVSSTQGSKLRSELPSNDINEDVNGDSSNKKNAEVFSFYSNNVELLTSYNSEIISGLIDDYSPEWVLEAFKECIQYNKRSLKYAEKILQGWKAHGFKVDTRQKSKAPGVPAKMTNFEKTKAILAQYEGASL